MEALAAEEEFSGNNLNKCSPMQDVCASWFMDLRLFESTGPDRGTAAVWKSHRGSECSTLQNWQSQSKLALLVDSALR